MVLMIAGPDEDMTSKRSEIRLVVKFIISLAFSLA